MANPKHQNPAPDVGQMFQLAEQYSIASNLLIKQSWGDKWGCGAPYLLVDSFAIELYLKCLTTQDSGKPADFSHNLRGLFDALQSTTKDAVRKAFHRVIDADVVLRLLPVINPDSAMVLDFDRSLTAASDTFDKRRYAYDSPPKRSGTTRICCGLPSVTSLSSIFGWLNLLTHKLVNRRTQSQGSRLGLIVRSRRRTLRHNTACLRRPSASLREFQTQPNGRPLDPTGVPKRADAPADERGTGT